MASCGLGSLKGQFLPAQYYTGEHTKLQILLQCLLLTGLELPIKISPALRNRINTKWHQLYLSGTRFMDSDKKKDAYTVLEELLGPINCIFQDKNTWHVVGVNKFNRFTIFFDSYDAQGNYINDVELLRNVEPTLFYGIPRIGVSTPRKRVEAFYKIDNEQIPDTVYKVKNDGYVLASDIVLVNHKWQFTSSSFTPKYSSLNGRVYLAPLGTYSASTYIVLRKPLLIQEGVSVQWRIRLQSEYESTATIGATPEELVADGTWDKLLPYDIFYVYSCYGQRSIAL